MKKVTQEDIEFFNKRYYECKNKSQVARESGFSTSTVSRYLISDYVPAAERQIKKFNKDLPKFSAECFKIRDWTPLLNLSEVEKEEMKELWEELEI